jgi:hypothetical protein
VKAASGQLGTPFLLVIADLFRNLRFLALLAMTAPRRVLTLDKFFDDTFFLCQTILCQNKNGGDNRRAKLRLLNNRYSLFIFFIIRGSFASWIASLRSQ